MSRVECFHPSCHCSFMSEASMLQHFTDRHNHYPNKLPCPRTQCNRSFSTKEALEEHLRSPAHQLNQIAAAAHAAAAAEEYDLVTRANILLLQEQQVACNDCGRLFKSTDSLHQHQWDCADHTRVSRSPPNYGSYVRACSQCGEKFGSADHLEDHFMEQHAISEVPESSEDRIWQIVAERFTSAWQKPTIKLDKVHRIFKVYNTGRRRKEFEEYRKELKNDMTNNQPFDEIRKKVLENGNQMMRYHGTTVKCRLGRPADEASAHTASLCTNMDCSLCRILQVGFKKSKCRQNKFQRYGVGIYTSSVSSKAHGYVKSDDVKENYKVMMVCKVLVGRPHHYTLNAEELEGPPMGYHSVQGDPGVVLNYDELVVYDDRAILPAFIILYSANDSGMCRIM